jgi:hypothetical protein
MLLQLAFVSSSHSVCTSQTLSVSSPSHDCYAAVPITSSVVSATRLLSSRRENATPAEKNRRRMLILQWHTLLIATLAYTIPTIVELFSHPGFTVDDSRNEDYETKDRGYPTFACRELRPTGWSPPAFTEVFWLINLLAADASLVSNSIYCPVMEAALEANELTKPPSFTWRTEVVVSYQSIS